MSAGFVAKNVLVNVSIGDADRAHTTEELFEAIRKVIPKKYNVTLMSASYVIDGKTYRAGDYDPKTQDVREGAVPPPWAGGPPEKVVVEAPKTAETKSLTPAQALGKRRRGPQRRSFD